MSENFNDAGDFSTRVSNVLNNTKDYDVDLQFYLTDSCNLGCNGCYMKSKPMLNRNIIPASDINFYLNEFANVPGFYNTVVFTGGEIFSDSVIALERNAHNVLDRGWHLQLKTNGAWVMQPQLRTSVIRMLDRLEPGRGMLATEEDMRRFLSRIPKPVLKMLGRDRVIKLLFKVMPSASLLDLAVSVDDKLHPAESADWFVEIANLISRDRYLRKNLNLKSFTVNDSKKFFDDKVLGHPELKIKKVETYPEVGCLKYNVNGMPVESYFGDFVDVDNVPQFKKVSEFVLPSVEGDTAGRLVYCFHPDKTVGLDSCYLESVGRVPYLDAAGKRKPFAQINQEIGQKLIADYERAKTK